VKIGQCSTICIGNDSSAARNFRVTKISLWCISFSEFCASSF